MAGRTSLAYLQNVLQDNWNEDITGRVQRVPEPYILLESERSETRVSQYDGDVIFVSDGGPENITPKGVGWTHRESEANASIDIRTSVGRARLEGVRKDDNSAENYGGLRGEVQRILDSVRKGDQEYDLVDGYEWNDLSADVGYQFWRGTFEVRLTQVAQDIDPQP